MADRAGALDVMGLNGSPVLKQPLNCGPSWFSMLCAYLVIIAYWVVYFVKGRPTLTGSDWLKEQAFTNVIRSALEQRTIPWRISEPFYHGIHELIANPEISLTPDLLMLGYLPNNTYFLVHWLIFATIGFFGLILLAKRLRLSSWVFVYVAILFNMNGFIGSHLSEGHIQWAGYFLFPFLFYWLPDIDSSDSTVQRAAAMKLGLLLGAMFLNGSFHIAVWCCMFMALILLYRGELMRWILLALLVGGLLGVSRLLPAALYLPAKVDFVSGYPSISVLLEAFTTIRLPIAPKYGEPFVGLQWHEYSVFIGYVGFVFIGFGIYQALRAGLKSPLLWWVPAGLVMLMFALGDVYQVMPNSGLPFANIERVASRFIIVPFLLALFVAAVGVTQYEIRHPRYTRLALMLSLAPMIGEIFQYARKWRLDSYEAVMGAREIPLIDIVPSSDEVLKMVVGLSWTASILTLATVCILIFIGSKQRP